MYEALAKDVFDAEKEYSELEGAEILSEFAELSANYNIARICLIKENYVQAKKHIYEYLKYYDLLSSDEEKQLLLDAVDFRRYLTEEYKATMIDYLTYCETTSPEPKNTAQEETGYGNEADRLQLLQRLPFEAFMKYVSKLTTASLQCFEDPFFERALTFFEERDQIKYLAILYKLSETELKRAVSRGITGSVISSLMKESVLAARKMYELIYTPESLSQRGIIWLSHECRFNAVVSGFLKSGERDFALLLEAAKIRPEMAQVIKSWLAAYMQ